jgi:hypothetical protein
MIRFPALAAAVFVALCAVVLAGCGTCVAKGDKVEVTIMSTPTLNDAGQGAQHVRFQAWAVRDPALFAKIAAERPEELAAGQNAERFAELGKVIDAGEWIKPASTRSGTIEIAEDKLYTHVGLIALYTSGAKTALVPLTCNDGEAGYSVKKPIHFVRFTMDDRGVAPTPTK